MLHRSTRGVKCAAGRPPPADTSKSRTLNPRLKCVSCRSAPLPPDRKGGDSEESPPSIRRLPDGSGYLRRMARVGELPPSEVIA